VPDTVSAMRMSTFTSLRILGACLILSALSLAGCTHVTRDGPPTFYVDDTKIPNAVPKIEPISRIGNKPYYTVFGVRYYVMRTSKDYEERGVASWYGTKFHSHHTSNGERYDMLAMTAAHKSLPLPTYVQVTNLRNGKQVIVKVNDRGPFESNRLIDLSYVAAKKLGMLGHGTTIVDVKAIDPRDAISHPELLAKKTETHKVVVQTTQIQTAQNKVKIYHHTKEFVQSKTVTQTIPSNRPIYVQVGAFRNRNSAERLRNRLSGFVSSPVAVNPSNSLYRVQIGPFKDIMAADRVSKKLNSMGMHTRRVNEDFDVT
jgi:rare lipoprotein A